MLFGLQDMIRHVLYAVLIIAGSLAMIFAIIALFPEGPNLPPT